MPKPGKTLRAVMDAPIQRIKDLGRARKGLISFAQGLPWFGPPEGPLERTLERLRQGEGDAYSPTLGREGLRELLAADLRSRGIASAAAGNIMVTPGANQGIFIILAALADRGDEVILFRPYYFNNRMALQMLGLKPALVDAGPAGEIDPGEARRRITSRTRAMIVISPNNPSGAMVDGRTVGELLRLCREHGFPLVSDEAYRDFAWDAAHVSPLAGDRDNAIGVFSFSKSYGMAGWRLGFVHAPEGLIPAFTKAADTLHICPPLPAQLLAEEALATDAGHPGRFRRDMMESRDLLIAALRPLQGRGLLGELRSAGGFYVFLRLRPRKTRSGWEIARRLVEEHAMAAVPGEAFGMSESPFLRLSYGNIRPGEMKAAAPRLAAALEALLGS